MRAGRPRVFDSWSLIALLEDESSAGKVRSLILEAQAAKAPMWISVVNLGEIWYNTARRRSAAVADDTVDQIVQLGFEIADVDWSLAFIAARFKARHPIAYADCFAAALARQRDAELVTGDPEFQRVEREVRIHWV